MRTEAISVLDAEPEATIQRLTRIRAELAVILRHHASPEVPPEFAPLAGDFSDSQKALLTVYSTVFSDEDLAEFSRALGERATSRTSSSRCPRTPTTRRSTNSPSAWRRWSAAAVRSTRNWRT